MAGLLDSHVRPGLAKSEGAKHKTVAGALSDVLDNARFHGAAFEGATKVQVKLGPQANAHLKALPTGANWLLVADNGKGMQLGDLEWGLLARGPSADPDGCKVVSFFNTGHHASFNKLGGEEVLIATVRDGVGILVRWGKTIVDALNRELLPNNAKEVKVRSAYLQFDMASGEVLPLPASASETDRSNIMISMAAFGLKQLGLKTGDMGFPMVDVTPAKLFSLFDGLAGSGTKVFTSTRVVTPSADGTEIMAGDMLLEDHLCNRWWLPPSAQLPWAQDVPKGGSITQRPFEVTLTCGGASRRVDWFANGWEAVVKAGGASKPMTLDFKGHMLHFQVACLDKDDASQMSLDGKLLMYRHARFTCAEALPRKGGSTELRNAGECMHVNARMESTGPASFGAIYDPLQMIYDGGWPVAKADMTLLSKKAMRTLLGEGVAVLVSCHDFEWQEGKEAFAANAVYPACLPALYSAAASYAAAHHPALEAEREEAKARKERIEAAAAKRAAALAAAQANPTPPPKPKVLLPALGPVSPGGADRGARVRKTVEQYKPEAQKAPSATKKNAVKRKAPDTASADAAQALKKIKHVVAEADIEWHDELAATPGVPLHVRVFLVNLLHDLRGALKMPAHQ